MSISVNLGTAKKRANSTARPAIGAGFSGTLKEPCSVTNPTISFHMSGSPAGYNYAYIGAFNRYYYIRDWSFSAGLWTASMVVDVMATYREEIGSSMQYITRASADYEGHVTDSLYPATTSTKIDYNYIQTPWVHYMRDGIYILGVINNKPTSVGGCITYYVMDQTQLNGLKFYLMGRAQMLLDVNVNDVSNEMLSTIFDPFHYLASCTWFPVSSISAGSASAEAETDGTPPQAETSEIAAEDGFGIGWWTTDAVSASLLASSVSTRQGTIALPKHPQQDRGQYLNGAPYTSYRVVFPPFGVIPIDSTLLVDATSISYRVYIDFVTGDAYLHLYEGGLRNRTLVVVNAHVGVPIALAQTRIDAGAATTAATTAVANVATGIGAAAVNAVAGNWAGAAISTIGAIASGVAGITSTAQTAMPKLSTSGSNGSIAFLEQTPHIVAEFLEIADEDNTHLGRPYCKTSTPASLGGYMLCANASVAIPGTDQEQAQVITTMNGGFYYE